MRKTNGYKKDAFSKHCNNLLGLNVQQVEAYVIAHMAKVYGVQSWPDLSIITFHRRGWKWTIEIEDGECNSVEQELENNGGMS